MKRIIKILAVASIILSVYSLYAQGIMVARNPALVTSFNNYGGVSVLFGLALSFVIPILLGVFSVITLAKK